MHRHVTVQLEVNVVEPALLAFQIAVATSSAREDLRIHRHGMPLAFTEVAAPHGGRMHVVDADPGEVSISYTADVDDVLPIEPISEHELLLYRRPSRYCPSDRFLATTAVEFGGIEDTGMFVDAVRRWVGWRLLYISGSSGPTDDAVDTLLLGEGVCRDFAHVVVSLLRARDVPARLAAVYAPGLSPMDFHAVAEAWVDGAWRVVDATGLAPRPSMLRISTGRDAADTAFMSVHHGIADLNSVQVLAVADVLPDDDPYTVVPLA